MTAKKYQNVWGIDVSKDWIDISINKKVERVLQKRRDMVAFIKKNKLKDQEVLAVLESTGGYERLTSQVLNDAGIIVHIAHPNKARYYAMATQRLAKTDAIDAQVLEDYGRFIDSDNVRPLRSDIEHKLSDVSSRIESLKINRHQEKCRLYTSKCKEIERSHERMIKLLDEQITQLTEFLLSLIKSDEALLQRYTLLKSMKGIGDIVAMTLLADLPELGRLNKKEVAALVGVAPITRESGKKVGHARIRYGRASVRRMLYVAALVAVRFNKRFMAFYNRLVGAGKSKKLALIAVARKMAVILNAMVQTNTVFKELS